MISASGGSDFRRFFTKNPAESACLASLDRTSHSTTSELYGVDQNDLRPGGLNAQVLMLGCVAFGWAKAGL